MTSPAGIAGAPYRGTNWTPQGYPSQQAYRYSAPMPQPAYTAYTPHTAPATVSFPIKKIKIPLHIDLLNKNVFLSLHHSYYGFWGGLSSVSQLKFDIRGKKRDLWIFFRPKGMKKYSHGYKVCSMF